MDNASEWLSDLVVEAENTEIGDTGYRWIDGDTIQNEDGKAIRIDGINTPEVGHERDIYSDEHYRGTYAGDQATKEMAKLAKERGFTEVVEADEQGVYGRTIGDLRNPETGQMFSVYAAQHGLANITPYSSEVHRNAYSKGLHERTLGVQDAETTLARDRITQSNLDEMERRGLADPFKRDAENEQEYAQNPYDFSGVAIRSPDRTIMNEANGQWSTSFDTALIGMTDAFHGFRQLLGEATGNDDLVMSGEEGSARAKVRMRLNPTTTLDLEEVDGVGDFVDYIANNFAMSVPYMATTVGSTLVGSGVGTLAAGPLGTVGGAIAGATVGLSAPMAIYSGQVYNEQENKNVNAALTSGFVQATLDRLGLKGIGMAGGVKGTLKEAADVLVKQGMSKEEALKKVTTASRKELVRYMDDAAAFAKRQISARNMTREVAAGFAKAFGVEAATEAMQEAVAYAGANWDKEAFGIHEEGVISEELINRMGKAAIAGGLVGGTMGTAGAVHNRAGWAQTAFEYGDARDTNVDKWAKEAEQKGELPHEYHLMAMNEDPDLSQPSDAIFRSDNYMDRQKDKGVIEKGMDFIYNTPRLWRGQARSIFTNDILQKSPTARRMAGMYGGLLNKIHSGRTFEESKHFNKKKWIAMAGNPAEYARNYKGIENMATAEKEFDKDFYKVAKDFVKHGEDVRAGKAAGPFDWSKYAQHEVDTFRPLIMKLNETSRKMLEAQNRSWMAGARKAKPKFKAIDNYLLRFKNIDKVKLEQNRGDFVSKLKDIYGMPEADANQLVTDILEGKLDDPTRDNDAIFNIMSKGFHPAASKKRTIGMSEEPALQDYFEQNLRNNLDASFSSAARFEAYHTYVGKDKWKLNQMLNQMQSEGLSSEQVDEIAFHMERYFQSESGNYKRPPKGSMGDRFLQAQKNLLTFSLFTSLPMSSISSIPELAMTTRGLTNDQIFGKNGSLKIMGWELGKMLTRGFTKVTQNSWKGNAQLDQSKVGELMDRLGYFDQEVGAATTTGATEVNGRRKWMIDLFFKLNGLQGLTNATRSIRAAMANDFILDKFETLRDAKLKDSEAHRFAAEQLRDLGLDIPRLQRLLDKESRALSQFNLRDEQGQPFSLTENEQRFLQEQMDIATFRFVNDAVALPGADNRPLFYQDPRFALITQFNGFIATITANHLPKMWNEYIKRGSPAMKYTTFQMMATMIMLGFVSQYLKDWLKYGQGENPYLTDLQTYRRAINSSGLLGTGERALNIAFPMYGAEDQSIPAWALDTALGEMPAMSPVRRLIKASQEAYQGDYTDAKYHAARGTPLIGPFNGVAKFLAGKTDDY